MKKNMTKVMAMGMVLTMLAGTTVFAVDGTATNDMAATGGEMDVKEEGFTTDSGKIVSVEKSGTDGVSVVEIENKNGGLRFAVDANSLILDRKDGSYKTVADLTEGMEVAGGGLQRKQPYGYESAPLSGQRDSSSCQCRCGQYDGWTLRG